MATYGLQATPGLVAFTGYTNTLGSGSAAQGATAGSVGSNGITQSDALIARVIRNGAMGLGIKQLLLTILGAAAGGTATKTKPQVQHVTGAPGGLIPIETINVVNRVTTAADVTAFTALVNRTVFPSTYAVDVGGNGGGGKAGI